MQLIQEDGTVRAHRMLLNVAYVDGLWLTCEQEGAYTRLLKRWALKQNLPNDDKQLADTIGVSRTVWRNRYASALRPLFSCDGPNLTPLNPNETVRLSQKGFGRSQIAPRIYDCNWTLLRAQVLERDDHTCQYCGDTDVPMTCDHVIPYSRGGETAEHNLVAACVPCNSSKGGKTPEEWRAM